ncbi:hypothetical protein [Embleya sp. NPDC005575]|uniref:hypothetical protein n=1 Tax=Embleya sp. NPDC005575 TaxID=3156892 RepID=UPI0033AF5002
MSTQPIRARPVPRPRACSYRLRVRAGGERRTRCRQRDAARVVRYPAIGANGDGYTIGVVTAVPFVLVVGVLAYHRLWRDGLLSGRRLQLDPVAGAAIVIPFVVPAPAFGKLVF